MAAQLPEEKAKGFTSEDIADQVKVEISFQHLYPGRVFSFIMRMEEEGDTEYLQQKFAGRIVPLHDQRLERLSRLLKESPTGFDDYPAGGDVQSSAKAFFGPKKFAHVVRGCLNVYDKGVTPDQLFR